MTSAANLLSQLPNLSDEQLKREYLNYLHWTEAIKQMLQLIDNETQVIRVVRLGLEVDVNLGVGLAKAVKPEFKAQTLKLVSEWKIPQTLKEQYITYFNREIVPPRNRVETSEAEIPLLIEQLEQGDFDTGYKAALELGKISSTAVILAQLLLLWGKSSMNQQSLPYVLL